MAAAELGGSAQHMERSWRRPFLSVPKLRDEPALGLQGAGGVGRGRGDAHLWCARWARDGGSGGGTPGQGARAVLRAHARGRGDRHCVQQLIQSLGRVEETSPQVGSVDRRTDQEPAETRDQPGAGDPEFQGAASSQVRTLEGPRAGLDGSYPRVSWWQPWDCSLVEILHVRRQEKRSDGLC